MPDLPFTIEELVELDHPSSVQLSPDGKHVAFVMGKAYKPDADHDPQKAIYLINVETQAMRRLTGGDATNDQPVWSPDSRTLAFLSNRRNAKEMQLYVIDIHGGEAQALTDLRGRVDVPQWSPAGFRSSTAAHSTRKRHRNPIRLWWMRSPYLIVSGC
jgi:Tol biopolymer transport system component